MNNWVLRKPLPYVRKGLSAVRASSAVGKPTPFAIATGRPYQHPCRCNKAFPPQEEWGAGCPAPCPATCRSWRWNPPQPAHGQRSLPWSPFRPRSWPRRAGYATHPWGSWVCFSCSFGTPSVKGLLDTTLPNEVHIIFTGAGGGEKAVFYNRPSTLKNISSIGCWPTGKPPCPPSFFEL